MWILACCSSAMFETRKTLSKVYITLYFFFAFISKFYTNLIERRILKLVKVKECLRISIYLKKDIHLRWRNWKKKVNWILMIWREYEFIISNYCRSSDLHNFFYFYHPNKIIVRLINVSYRQFFKLIPVIWFWISINFHMFMFMTSFWYLFIN